MKLAVGIDMDCKILEAEKILVVDDEPAILATVAQVLASSQVVTVRNVDEVRPLIDRKRIDLVIFDAVDANCCALLETCHANNLPAAMLTDRVVDVKGLKQAEKLGDMLLLPKDELHLLPERVAEIIERSEKEKTSCARLPNRVGSFFKRNNGRPEGR